MNNMNNEKNKSSVILNPERSEWVSRSHVTSVEIVVNDGAKTQCYSVKRDLYGDFAYAQPLKMTEKALSLSGASSEPIISAESKRNQAMSLRGRAVGSDVVIFHAETEKALSFLLRCCAGKKRKKSSLVQRKSERQAIFKFVLSSASGGAGGGKYNRISAFVSMPVLLIRRSLEKFFKKNFRDDSFTFGFAKVLALALILTIATTAESSAADLANPGSCGDGCLYQITEENGERNLVVYNVPNYTGVANIAGNAFSYAVYGEQANFNKVTIKGNFDNIGDGAFKHSYNSNTGFNELIIEGKIKNIGTYSFYGNTLISDITLPEGLEKIGKSAFSHSFNISSLVIPNTVTDIDTYAFSFINRGDNYSRIDSVTLPESLVHTGDYIFNRSNIGEIVIPDTLNTDTWSEKTFFNDTNTPSSFTVACKGIMQECQKAMSKFIAKTDGGIGTCEGQYCLNPNKISFASAGEADCKGERYWYHNGVCQLNPLTTYAKKRWTPAEANEWLRDGNDNFVVLTFKK